jgi:hypothetical protein
MTGEETCTWIGASGKEYKYYIYKRHPQINKGEEGNYIYAKVSSNRHWVPVYIGQGDLFVRATGNHPQIECIDRKGATHIHVHLNSEEMDRLAEKKDLLANYPNVYTPNGCNVPEGG